jgi:anti-anti-sigma factor
MTTTIADVQAENARLRQQVAALEQSLAERQHPAEAEPHSAAPHARIDLFGVPIEWQLDAGICTFQGAAVATMFIEPTLAGLMSGFQKMVGSERFFLAMQSEGRRNIDIDWEIITSQPDFEQGFAAWARFPILAGWGRWELLSLDSAKQEARIRVQNSFEGLYQRALGVCWGSGVAAGKCSGIFSLLFETECWAEQVEFIARGDAYDTFVVHPSDRSIEQEIDQLLASDATTRADLAVALQKLQYEMDQRKEIEAELRRSQSLLQGLIDGLPAGVVAKDRDGRYLIANTFAAQRVGRMPDELIGLTDFDILSSEEAGAATAREQQVFATGKPVERETTMSLVEGTYTVIATNFPIRDDQGTMYAVGGIGLDITERKQAEAELQTFKALAESSPDAIGIAAPDGVISYTNQSFQQMFGYGDATVGMLNVTLFTEADQRERIPTLLEEISTRGAWTGLLTGRRKDGSTFPAQVSAFGIADSQGNLLALPAIIRDMSEQQRQEAERAALQQQVIDAQRDALRELSSPLIPISEDVVIMPLIGTIDSGRAQQVLEVLLEGVAQHQAELVILDITGVSVVDTQVAQALVRAAQAVKLLGAQVMLTGIQPQIAQTLVHLGVELSGIITRGSLQAGISAALERHNHNTGEEK